ncbi:MAG: hypothetical protein FD147_1946 [Chloroflexi bacterium]|nr:MAG: hypothetical protein FD147_1946 [Chloroflexota bacterium]
MKPTILSKLLIIIVVTSMALSACTLPISKTPQSQPGQLETITAGQVSARLTQIAIETLIAQVTLQAMASFTPLPTNTLAATSTPLATNTPLPPTITPIPPTATATPIPCNLATFIGDITVKDGAIFTAGESFVKTWRVKNSGSCTWTTAYTVYFVNGNAMSAPASVTFPKTVKPGESVDLSVSMIAPGTTGDFKGNWMMSAPNGVFFGVGAAGGVPMNVKIKVTSIPNPKDPNTIYDFVKNYCAAQWRTNAGFIGCPTGSYDFKNGTVARSYAPILENGLADDEGALITIPSIGGDGFIRGQFPKMIIHSGDHFKASLLCSNKMTKCSVTFELLYQEYGTASVTSLGAWDKIYDNSIIAADVDLSALDGKDVIFFLKVSSKADPTDDLAQWMAARITHP